MPIEGLTPYAHVADIERSVAFYRLLGLELRNSYEEGGRLVWAYVTGRPAGDPDRSAARLILALAEGPVDPAQQAVLFYCWTADVEALHAELKAAGVNAGEIEYPSYMPSGEFGLTDPDGYAVIVGQLD